ncbi:hypothetical protein D3C84_1120800 [compost metagenome]
MLGIDRGVLLGDLAEDLQRVLAHQQSDHHHDRDAAQAQSPASAQAHTAATHASGVFHIVAATRSLPAHDHSP